MARDGRRSAGRAMRQAFFVFCEGKTEAAYVRFLGAEYRAPVQVVPKPAKSNISRKDIDHELQRCGWSPRTDRVFLMFDLDVEGMADKLGSINGVTTLLSNPCVELWFLLHVEDVRAELTSNACLDKLKSHVCDYRKGCMGVKLQAALRTGLASAVGRAKSLRGAGNPSSTVYLLADALEAARSDSNVNARTRRLTFM